MITEISNICLPNTSGLANVSLINVQAIDRLQLYKFGNQSRLDLHIKEDYLQQKKFQLNFKVTNESATFAQSATVTPDGTLYNQSLTLKAQLINKNFLEAIEADLKIKSKHILYMVYKNGYTFIVGSTDNPIIVQDIAYDSITPTIQVNLSGQTPDPAQLIFTQSVPHFFKLRSHAFTNDFYNFE